MTTTGFLFILLAVAALVLWALCAVAPGVCFLWSLAMTTQTAERVRLVTTKCAKSAKEWVRRALWISICCCGIVMSAVMPAQAGEPAQASALAAAEAPEDLGKVLAVAAFVMTLILLALQIRGHLSGTKIQQPLTVQASDKFATASAFSRHCEKQERDLLRIEQFSTEKIAEVAEQLHQLSREVSDISGRSEINTKRMERMEQQLVEILQRLPRTRGQG